MSKMRFWIPDTERMVQDPTGRRADLVPAKQVDPDWWRQVTRNKHARHLVNVEGRKIEISTEYETNDPAEVRTLIRDAGLRCEVEDAVFCGILTLAELQSMGYCHGKVELKRLEDKLRAAGRPSDFAAIKRDVDAALLEKHPKPPDLPDFDLMTREALFEFANNDEDPDIAKVRQGDPIHVSSTWSKERMVEKIKKTLRGRGDKRVAAA